MPNSKTRPNQEVQAQRIATMRSRYGNAWPLPRREIGGQRFGRLTALHRVGMKDGRTFWAFACDCGAIVERRLTHVVAGRTSSCGCHRDEASRIRFTTHGHSQGGQPSPEYISWSAMRARCEYATHPHFKNYGGRGITVCSRWRVFENFLADMGPRPPGSTIDRYPNNNGNYEPDNCRWATRKQQAANTRRRHG